MTRAISMLDRPAKVLAPPATALDEQPAVACGRSVVLTSKRQMQISPMRIGLFGLFGCGNSGNDGSLEAMLTFLQRVLPDAKLACICGAPDRVVRDFGLAASCFGTPEFANVLLRPLDRLLLGQARKLASFVRAIRKMRSLDALIVPGTGILDDFGESPFGMPLVLFAWCTAARLCGARIAFVSIGAGPIHHPISRWLMKSAVAMAQYRTYRDTVSKAYMDSIGFDTRDDAVYPDIAFRLPPPPSTLRHTQGRPLTVGVGLMTYLGWRNRGAGGAKIYAAYLEKITNFVLWLLDSDYPVRVLMGDTADQRAVNDLLARIGRARPELPKDRLAFNPIASLHDLMDQIAETDVVVATRYHNVVCALKLGRPTVSIGYADKNDVLMAEMGLRGFCQHVERLDVDLLIEQFSRLIADREQYEQAIDGANRAIQERLDHQDAILTARLLERTGSREAEASTMKECGG